MKILLSVLLMVFVLVSAGNVVADAAKGKALFGSKACYSCHSIGDKGSKMGPGRALDHVGKKRSRSWLTAHLKDPIAHRERDPASHTGNISMPKIDLTAQEITDLVDFMLTLK